MLVDVIITTCGTLDHDLARVWRKYYHGDFLMDDARLHRQGINRLGNILIPNESYGIVLEQKMQPILEELYSSGKKTMSSRELAREFGLRLKDKKSILYWAAKSDIPIYVPGITDGAFGSQLWLFKQKRRDFNVDIMKDEQELADIVFSAKRSGAIMIGGGISKHHVICCRGGNVHRWRVPRNKPCRPTASSDRSASPALGCAGARRDRAFGRRALASRTARATSPHLSAPSFRRWCATTGRWRSGS